MLLCAAQVWRPLMYAGSLVGEFGLLASGIPMNDRPWFLRQLRKVPNAVKNLVVGSCCASGIVSLAAAVVAAESAPAGGAAAADSPSPAAAGVAPPAGALVGAAACSPGFVSW